MRTITLEEHFLTESFVRATGAPRFAELQPKLLDLGAGRIADMDEAGIDLQVLSLASMGFDALDKATATALAHDVNDEVAEAVRAQPNRLAAFAMVSWRSGRRHHRGTLPRRSSLPPLLRSSGSFERARLSASRTTAGARAEG